MKAQISFAHWFLGLWDYSHLLWWESQIWSTSFLAAGGSRMWSIYWGARWKLNFELFRSVLTRCLSTLTGLRWGSYSNLSGSMFIGLCRLPLVHSDHWGFISPQKDGPERQDWAKLSNNIVSELSWFRNSNFVTSPIPDVSLMNWQWGTCKIEKRQFRDSTLISDADDNNYYIYLLITVPIFKRLF